MVIRDEIKRAKRELTLVQIEMVSSSSEPGVKREKVKREGFLGDKKIYIQ